MLVNVFLNTLLCGSAGGCLPGDGSCCFVKFGVAAFGHKFQTGHPAVPCVPVTGWNNGAEASSHSPA